MKVKLPKILEIYVHAANAGDPEMGSSCFSENAIVLDEGETLKGRRSIRDWMVKTKKKYNHFTKPLKFREVAGEAIMTAKYREPLMEVP
ncbi:MAG: nuclear transport factor 2 family protein [Deltaproteobacteria bacterium]|nr:MAG: nuclear transport factor 2 family protein [Deltaproteobacteria bacterium]